MVFGDQRALSKMDATPASVVQLAEQLSEGFTALSGEYQVLFDQQRQLESKLSWAKQQVCNIFHYHHLVFHDEYF